jgi:hypothetical protein
MRPRRRRAAYGVYSPEQLNRTARNNLSNRSREGPIRSVRPHVWLDQDASPGVQQPQALELGDVVGVELRRERRMLPPAGPRLLKLVGEARRAVWRNLVFTRGRFRHRPQARTSLVPRAPPSATSTSCKTSALDTPRLGPRRSDSQALEREGGQIWAGKPSWREGPVNPCTFSNKPAKRSFTDGQGSTGTGFVGSPDQLSDGP